MMHSRTHCMSENLDSYSGNSYCHDILYTWKSNFSFKKVIKSLEYFHALDKDWSWLIHLKRLIWLNHTSHTVILSDWTLEKRALSSSTFQSFYGLIGTQNNFFLNFCEGFLRAALTGHGHPSQFWKIAKMALFNPHM